MPLLKPTLSFVFTLCLVSLSSHVFSSELPTVGQVELKRYLGTWYEIASFPAPFQKNCVATTATYTLKENRDIDILNECKDKTLTGKTRTAHGKAWVVDKKTNSKLKVSFFWPFSGNYWIIDLGKNYDYAVVSEPRLKYLWILSRARHMEQPIYDKILTKLRKLGFDLSRLHLTLQPST